MKSSKKVALYLTVFIFLSFAFTAMIISLGGQRYHSFDRHTDIEKGRTIMEKNFSVKSGDRLTLDTDIGDIIVTGSEINEMNIKVIEDNSKRHRNKFHVDFNQNDNLVSIKGRYGKNIFRFFENGFADIRFEINLPKNYNLNVETSGGDLIFKNVNGNLEGVTSGGDITVENDSGIIGLSTSGGDIDLKWINGKIKAVTSGGRIRGDSLAGSADIETSGGNIDIENSDAVLKAATSGGDIKVDLFDNKGIHLTTSGGNLRIVLPESIKADLEAFTSDGNINCEFPILGKTKEGEINGKINGGGNVIRAESSGGDIRIMIRKKL